MSLSLWKRLSFVLLVNIWVIRWVLEITCLFSLSFSVSGLKKLGCVTDKRLDRFRKIVHVKMKYCVIHAESNVLFFSMFVFHLFFICIAEQNDRRRCIWICLVYSQAAGLPHFAVSDNEIAKTANDHCGEIYGFIIGGIHKRKILITEL